MKKIRLLGSPASSSYSHSHASSIQRLTDQTYLTEDFLYEIFLRLPLDSIFKFKCVSKVWLSILSNPNFINKWYKVNTSLWALVHASATNGILKVTLSYPELNSQFISRHQSGFSLRFLNQKYDLSNTNSTNGPLIIGSSNGLVLCTTSYFNQKTYYVCNPLTKKSVLLPPPPKVELFVQTGFTCDECCFSSSLVSTVYKVIRVLIFDRATTFEVEIFSSDLGKWYVYHILCPPDVTWSLPLYDNFVSHNGTFYWLQNTSNKILAFSANVNKHNNHGTYSNDSKLIKLPDQPMDDENKYLSQCLGESEGFICYAIVRYKERSLSVWVLDEDWNLVHKDIKFYDMLGKMKPLFMGVESSVDLITDIQVLGFNPVDKNVVILHYDKHIWAYNIKTRGYEQLSNPSFLVEIFQILAWVS